jgi:phosphate transport system ATP-binding protein
MPDTKEKISPRLIPRAEAEGDVRVTTGAAQHEVAGDTSRQVRLQGLNAFYGNHQAVRDVNLAFEPGRVTGIIGPSGCGKSTLVRCVNRMHEEVPGARSEGRVLLDGVDLHDRAIDVVSVRRFVGMVFQKPNPFPTMSIFGNVAAGLRFTSTPRNEVADRVTEALQGAGLWDEVKDRLSSSGLSLSGGQQQRLCIARALAVQPQVLLMDEPCSALDPIATLKIEELVSELKDKVTIVLVTHNMQQAARIADTTAFMLGGELIEVDSTEKMFTNPSDDRTEQYVTGKYG